MHLSSFIILVLFQNSTHFWSCIVFYLQFHFDQSKIRSEIRLREGRTKPIDILTKHLDPADDFEIEINEPYLVFKVKFIIYLKLCIAIVSSSNVQ